MEVYKDSGKTKTGENLRITKPVGALVIKSDLPLKSLSTEKISIDVERVDGNNENIAIAIPLKHFIMLTTFGEAAIQDKGDEGFTSLCEIADNGSIELEENASIRVSMDNLKSANTYEIHGVEYPILRTEALAFDKKVVLKDETTRNVEMEDADLIYVDGASAINTVLIRYDNDEIVKRSLVELQALENDIDPFVSNTLGRGHADLGDILIIATVGVESIEFDKDTTKTLNISLMNSFDLVDEDGDGTYDAFEK